MTMRCIIFILFVASGVGQKDTKNYGPYTMTWEQCEPCRGPKQAECGKFEITNVQNMSDVVFLLDFPKDCPATMGKIIVSTKSNNVTKRLWNHVISNPCEHFVLGPVLIDSFNLTRNCKIDKGRYEIHLDLAAKTKIFLGTSFFYGTYIFNTMSYNKVSNFFCMRAVIKIRKP